MSRAHRGTFVVALVLLAMTVLSGAAAAHEERESFFPDYDGAVPAHRTFGEANDVRVVCKPDSADRIGRIRDAKLRAFNRKLLDLCEYEHIQAAVDDIRANGPAAGRVNLYVLPGRYLEEPSRDPECAKGYDGGVVTYKRGFECPNLVNLVGIFGDDPDDDDRRCDNPLCFLQLEGTGETAEAVLLRGGFRDSDGYWIDNHNGIKADRADGFYVKNLTVELVRENAIYVHETNGYTIDGTVTRYNDLYGILTFTSDHGLMQDCLAHHHGDGGIYPGSPADIYADEDFTGPLPRPVVEITRCEAHHNALGHSASGGNGIKIHDNDFHHNQAGVVVDSFVPDHPGMPVDHNWFTNNRIWANNENFYEEFLYSGVCDKPPAERGYEKGTVCPAFPIPVGTGILIAGGNHNLVTNNQIWDNWRNGIMQFWVPGMFRGDPGPENQYDTSHHNHYRRNRFGLAPGGLTQPNGVDMWWDDQGNGNCWQGNTSSAGTMTSNTVLPGGLPDCESGGSVWTVGNPVKSAGLATCATFDREDNPQPPGCDWFTTPDEPEGREGGPGGGGGNGGNGGGDDAGDGSGGDDPDVAVGDTGGAPVLPATGGSAVLTLLGLAALGAAGHLHARRTR